MSAWDNQNNRETKHPMNTGTYSNYNNYSKHIIFFIVSFSFAGI